jgi:hypothetical protein
MRLDFDGLELYALFSEGVYKATINEKLVPVTYRFENG